MRRTESAHAREAAIDVHREVLAGSAAKVVPELREILPELMWLSQMGLVLYWVFDRSEGHRRSRRLADRGARLTARGVALSRFRVLRRWSARSTNCSPTSSVVHWSPADGRYQHESRAAFGSKLPTPEPFDTADLL